SRLAAPKLVAPVQGLTIPQPDATNYPPARHRTPGDIMSEYRATSSRNARATSSESADGEARRDVMGWDVFISQQDRNYERSRGIWTNLFGGSKKSSEENSEKQALLCQHLAALLNTLRPCSRML